MRAPIVAVLAALLAACGSGALAATAAAWAALCRDLDAPVGLVDHNPGRSAGSAVYVGENIYGSSAAGGAVTGPQPVEAWAAEAASYDHASNTCAAGQVCGHYTQIVWRATARVGCAKQDCPGLTYRTTVVCDYAPGGNIVGQRPY